MQWHPILLLDMWSLQLMQSEQHVLNMLMAGGAREAQADMEETDREDCYEWKLTTADLQERSTWKSGVRSSMGAVKGPH